MYQASRADFGRMEAMYAVICCENQQEEGSNAEAELAYLMIKVGICTKIVAKICRRNKDVGVAVKLQ